MGYRNAHDSAHAYKGRKAIGALCTGRGDEQEVVQQVQNPGDVKFILGRPLQRRTERFENVTRTGTTKGETFVIVKIAVSCEAQ